MLTIREFVEVNHDAESIIITDGNDSWVYYDPTQVMEDGFGEREIESVAEFEERGFEIALFQNDAHSQMMEIYTRTLRNCEFYAEQDKPVALANEIGVLRGIGYCLESVGICPHSLPGFMDFIALQQSLKADEETYRKPYTV